MAVSRQRWWHRYHLEFILVIPFLSIRTRAFYENIERMTYEITRLEIKLWKWSWSHCIWKNRRDY